MNYLHGTLCPSVVCVQPPKPGEPTTPVFRWQDEDEKWHDCDELPAEIASALPGPEWARCEVHAWRRMGAAKGAA